MEDSMSQENYIEEMIDSDNDGLDDRLVDDGTPARNVQEVISRVNNIHIQRLNVSFLWLIKNTLEKEKEDLLQKALCMERQAHDKLIRGDYHVLSQTRKNLRLLKKKQDELTEKENQIWNVIFFQTF